MLHYNRVILHALLLHISTVLYLSIYSVFSYYPVLVCLGWLLITLFFIQYCTVFHVVLLFVMWQHAALRHAATSPNLYNDIILPSVLT